jgi:uncharacterized membrane protein YhaH (DUF805 family)
MTLVQMEFWKNGLRARGAVSRRAFWISYVYSEKMALPLRSELIRLTTIQHMSQPQSGDDPMQCG